MTEAEADEMVTTSVNDSGRETLRNKLCRLCLSQGNETGAIKFNIFEEEIIERGSKKALESTLYELFQIKYEKTSNLPCVICQRCLEMVQAFSEFRGIVQQCEEQLQNRIQFHKTNVAFETDDKRPGLNGNPGIFMPNDDCEIIEEIDPEQEFETSDEDFSGIESDTETEDISPPVPPVSQSSSEATATVGSNNQIPAINANNSLITPIEAQQQLKKPPVQEDVSTAFNESLGYEFTIKNTYLCQYCDMAFATQTDMVDHESRHDPALPFFCNFCSVFKCGNRQNLIAHIKENHDRERPYVCALCSKGFCRRSDLKKHTIVHTGVRPYSCPVCAKSFSRNTNLTKHMRIHNSMRPYVCANCPRSFSTEAELVRHSRTHADVKQFQCSRCPQSFMRKDKLQIHEQSHFRKESEFLLNQAKHPGQQHPMLMQQQQSMGTMENIVIPLNPFSTDGGNDESYNVHYQSRVYAPEQASKAPPPPPKPAAAKSSNHRLHICSICEKSFTRERDLHRHQALHLDTLFTCKQCSLGFSRREKLARHELEHHGPQYPCNICRITFHKTEELDMHMKMHELQQNAAISAHQAALNAAGVGIAGGVGVTAPMELTTHVTQLQQIIAPPVLPPPRPLAADLSFYTNMVPTMNLGFYSETRPEDRNGI